MTNGRFLDLLAARRSCRRFTEEPLDKKDLNSLLLAANAAPVGSNMNADIFLTVVTDRNVLDELATAIKIRRTRNADEMKRITQNLTDQSVPRGKDNDPFYGAPAVIFVSHRKQTLQPGIEYSNVMSVAMAIHLEATDLGLGSVFMWGSLEAMRLYPEYDRTSLLQLPEGFEPLLGLAVGHPLRKAEPRELRTDKFGCNSI